jgi:hypothetical protein
MRALWDRQTAQHQMVQHAFRYSNPRRHRRRRLTNLTTPIPMLTQNFKHTTHEAHDDDEDGTFCWVSFVAEWQKEIGALLAFCIAVVFAFWVF